MNLKHLVECCKNDIIESTRGIIRIRSVKESKKNKMPFGEGVNSALEYALGLAKSLGFETGNVDGYAGYAEFGSGEETLAILVHLDVVPEGVGWTYPPYAAEIHDGKIYGRGAIDNKGPAIAALFAMKAVMESGLPVNKKVRMIFGLDEESGWEDMKYYFQHQPMPEIGIVPDGMYPVIHAEKGIIDVAIGQRFSPDQDISAKICRIKGGERPNMVPDRCVCVFDQHGLNEKILSQIDVFCNTTDNNISADFCKSGGVVIEASGLSAHGSTPEQGKNAIAHMLGFLSLLGLGESDMEQFLLMLNDKIGKDTRGVNMGLAMRDDVSGELTLNFGMLEVDKEKGRAVLNIRYPVSFSKETILERIQQAFAGQEVEIEIIGWHRPLYLPKDHKLVKTLLETYARQTGRPAEALAIGGGTYARALENAVAFGAVFPGAPELAHQKDEYIEIEDLMLNAAIYAHAIIELVK